MGRSLDWSYEDAAHSRGCLKVAGVDEVGRGPLAGPVVAAAYCFRTRPEWVDGLDDSKKLTPSRRERLFSLLFDLEVGEYAIAQIEADEIDSINILQASMKAMRLALSRLPQPVDYALIDGNRMPGEGGRGEAIIKGDSRSPSIAAASVIAKVTRDRIMEAYEDEYPGYGFARHKGYGTRQHLEALRRLGPCAIHRRSFAPVAQSQHHLP